MIMIQFLKSTFSVWDGRSGSNQLLGQEYQKRLPREVDVWAAIWKKSRHLQSRWIVDIAVGKQTALQAKEISYALA